MTAAADDPTVEEAFEAYLAGRRVPAARSGLASFADAVRASASEPGRPSAALADLLANGLLLDQPGPAAQPSRGTRRRRTRMLAPALLAKLMSAGLAAKAATVAGVAVVGLTTVGFTGNLGPAQHTFATLVDQATPFTAPDPAPAQADLAGTPADDGTGATPVTSPSPGEAPTELSTAGTDDSRQESDDSAEKAAGTARPAHPSNYGGQVREWAHQKNEDRKSGATTVPAKPSKQSRHGRSGDGSGGDSEQGSHGSGGSDDFGSTDGSDGSDH
jgi:uncharacterized membrane protein YgcG